MNSASLDQDEPIWDEESYLSDPLPMSYDEWLFLRNAPVPVHEEIYAGGEEVWVLLPNAMDLVECGVASGGYKWHGHGFYVGVELEGEEIWTELRNVWKCEGVE